MSNSLLAEANMVDGFFAAAHDFNTYDLPDESGVFPESFEEIINGFRFSAVGETGKRVFYGDLEGSERSALPSVTAQVAHLESVVLERTQTALEVAQTCKFDVEDPDYLDSRSEMEKLCTNASNTRTQYHYWETNYASSEDKNPQGRFVKWAIGRQLRPVIQAEVEILLGTALPSPSKRSAQLALPTVPLSKIAKNERVRRTAYEGRMEAKIGLACMNVITEEHAHNLQEFFVFGVEALQPPDLPTPDLIGDWRRREAALARLAPLWQPESVELRTTAEAVLPF